MKEFLNNLVEKYETEEFIKKDPIQFPHRFKNKKDIEIAAFLSSCFAFGNRKAFITKLETLFELMQNEPFNFIENFDEKILKNFYYRFANTEDIINLFKILHKLYKTSDLETLFKENYRGNIFQMFQKISDYFYESSYCSKGYQFLIPNPKKGCAMKRMNMFLRWMVRKPPVDLNLWSFIEKDQLLIPLDIHVSRISRELNLLHRKSNDYNAVIELTEKLKEFDKNDPAKYDFALFGYGIDKTK